MIDNTLVTYKSPDIKVMTIETEQVIMAGSIENIGNVKDEQEW